MGPQLWGGRHIEVGAQPSGFRPFDPALPSGSYGQPLN